MSKLKKGILIAMFLATTMSFATNTTPINNTNNTTITNTVNSDTNTNTDSSNYITTRTSPKPSVQVNGSSVDSNKGAADVLENVGHLVYANVIMIANAVGSRISMLLGVIIAALFLLDIGKMILTSQLSQINLGTLAATYLNRLLMLGLVTALLLFPIHGANNATTIFQVIINKMLNMFISLGTLFFNDKSFGELISNSSTVINTPLGDYVFKAGEILPGKIITSIVGIPLGFLSYGVDNIKGIFTFFSGLMFLGIGLYILTKVTGMMSIYVSAIFEFIVLLTLSSIYLPFALLESTKNKLGNKPLELLITQGIKVVVTVGLLGLIVSITDVDNFKAGGLDIGTAFIYATAFSIFEKIFQNNNQIASTILNGGGLGVSSGNDFFAIASQVGALAAGASVLVTGNIVGGVKAGADKFAKTGNLGESIKSGLGTTFSMPIKLLKNTATQLGIDGIFQGKEKDAKNGTNPKTKAQKMAENEIEHLKTTLDSGMPDSVDMAYNMMYLMGMLTGNDALKSGAFVIKNYGSEAIENRLKKAEAARDTAIKANNETNKNGSNFTNEYTNPTESKPFNNDTNGNANDNKDNDKPSENTNNDNVTNNDNNENYKNEKDNKDKSNSTGNEIRPVDNSNPTKTTATASETNKTTDNRTNNKETSTPLNSKDINKTLNNSKPKDNKGV